MSHRHCVCCASGISQLAWEHSLLPRMALQVCSSPSRPGSPKCIGSASKHQSELLGGADAPLPLQMKILKLKEAKVKLSKREGLGFELRSVWPQSPWFDSHFPLWLSVCIWCSWTLLPRPEVFLSGTYIRNIYLPTYLSIYLTDVSI